MSHSKRREEAAWKGRKQAQHPPHGKVKALAEFASEYEAENKK
ncbi:DUF6254 family protein [Paenibacillus pectinilyticus]|nr:DUF6254 family protein [Paenibacillus pectinilyticus]